MKCEFRYFFWFSVFDYEYYVKCVCEYTFFCFVLCCRNLYKKRMIWPTQASFEICLCGEQHHHHEGAFNIFPAIYFCVYFIWSVVLKQSEQVVYCCVYQIDTSQKPPWWCYCHHFCASNIKTKYFNCIFLMSAKIEKKWE